MFELVYLHPFTNSREIVTDESKMKYCSIGVIIELTKKTSILIPWHRVLSFQSTTEAMDLVAEYTAFG